ncbi:GTP cyclohydrolase II [Candidatus Bandiella euplotis]|uniref:GTP cyclohydrolase II n=1 Tax=Candidatus Bandiella euplotis TaxID=1664265 RepID=A0ABZ0UMH7_9RICK|nr:GTP cyclohydrolase II [Candidatus Bandiella woodruffii]WPX96919.1 GTP cyclohydrolase II domain protein [Candidatus Bandiella woodruffii]
MFCLNSVAEDNLLIAPKTSLEEKSLSLLKLGELIQAAITVILGPDDKVSFPVNSLDADDVENYLKHIQDEELKEICEAEIHLKLAKGKIKAFRSEFGKDHYAVIIYPKEKNTIGFTPLVRVHSSCFTGDILASIKCDCFDQLQSAIKIMSEQDGGVIIYLNQEGRGIGLTNKIRVYQAQSLGLDTVEANEAIGLQEDARNFTTAAKILKLLNIRTIKLLSNNPAKSDDLTKDGIIVSEIVSHQFLNAEVKKYYQTKVDKLKHKIDLSTEQKSM